MMAALASNLHTPRRFPPPTATTSSGPAEVIELFPQAASQQPEIPNWLAHFVNRINELLEVQGAKGSVNGVFLSIEMIFKATHLLGSITTESTGSPLIGLNDDGSLHFEWESEDHFLTITLSPTSGIDFFYEDDDGTKEPVENSSENIKILRALLKNFKD